MDKKAEKILNATIKLFLQNGIKKVTVDDIAQNSNVSKVTLYKYFIDKDTLYLEIGKIIFEYYITQLNSILASDEKITKKLFKFIDIISDFSNSGKLSLCMALSKFNPAIEQKYASYMHLYRSTLFSLIEEGKRNNLIKNNYDSNILFHYIDMGIAYYQNNFEYRNQMQNDMRFQNEFMLLYMNNIFSDCTKLY